MGVGVGVDSKKLREIDMEGADIEEIEDEGAGAGAGVDDEGRVESVEAAAEGNAVVDAEFTNVAVTDALGADEVNGLMSVMIGGMKLSMRLMRVSMPSGDGAGAGAIVRFFFCSMLFKLFE